MGPSKASFGQILSVFFKNSGIQKIPQLLGGLKVVVTRSSWQSSMAALIIKKKLISRKIFSVTKNGPFFSVKQDFSCVTSKWWSRGLWLLKIVRFWGLSKADFLTNSLNVPKMPCQMTWKPYWTALPDILLRGIFKKRQNCKQMWANLTGKSLVTLVSK